MPNVIRFPRRRKNSVNVSRILQDVIAELVDMPEDEFQELLEQHKDGDIARALLDSGAAERFLRQWKRKPPKS